MQVCFGFYIISRIAVLFIQPLDQVSDAAWYYQRAAGIVAGLGYSEGGVLTAFWPVGWPGFLAVLFMVTGPSVLSGQIANLVLSALIFPLTARLGTLFFGDRIVGRGAVLILTVYPNQIGYVPLLTTEVFFEFQLLLSIYLLTRDRLPWVLLSGVVFGVATLTKAQTVFLPGFVLLAVFLAAPSRQLLALVAKRASIVYIATLLVIAPWCYRNFVVFDAFIPTSTNGGWTMLTGNNPEANGDYTPNTVLAEGISHDPAQQVAMDRLARARAIDWIQTNPTDFSLLIPRKLFRLWAPDGESEWLYQRGFAYYDANVYLFRTLRGLNQVLYLAILSMALPSVWWVVRRNPGTSYWAITGIGLCIYSSLISIAFSGQSRFHFSLMPFIAIYAARTLVGDSRNDKSRSSP